MAHNDIKVLLFDLGGVLCRLHDPIETFGLQQGHAEFMERWLKSPAVREFERGAINAETFAQHIVTEAGLAYDADEFLRRFDAWPDRLFPGTLELLQMIPARYERALLSNTNANHWGRDDVGGRLRASFGRIFLSFETGLLKPDAQAFLHVVAEYGCTAQEILFFDDNPLNVRAAIESGCRAELIDGHQALRRALTEYGVLTGT
jgi:putative hydrolase of the HAD superfamily